MITKKPGQVRKTPAKFYCRTHPTYQAKKRPTRTCLVCHELYKLKGRVYDHLGKAAGSLSKLLGVDVELTAELSPWVQFGRYTGTSTSAIRLKTVKK